MKGCKHFHHCEAILLLIGLSFLFGLFLEDFLLFTLIHEIGHIIAAGGGRLISYNQVALPVKTPFVMAFGEVFLILFLTIVFIFLEKKTWAAWFFLGVLLKSFFTAQRLTDMSYCGAYELFLCLAAPLVAISIFCGGSRFLSCLGDYIRECRRSEDKKREFQEYLKVLKTVGFSKLPKP